MVLLFHRPNFFYKTTKRNILQMPPSLISSYFLLFFYLQPHARFSYPARLYVPLSFTSNCLWFWCPLFFNSGLPALLVFALFHLNAACALVSALFYFKTACALVSAILQAVCPALFCCLTEQLYSFPYSLRPVPAPFFLHCQGQRLSDLYLHL